MLVATSPITGATVSVTVDENGVCDFADDSVTENTRVSYPIDHIEKIEEQLKAQKGLLGLPNAVEIAYKLVKEQLKSEPATLAKDPEFINKYILTDSNITAAIIDQYIKSLASKQTPPKLISGESKSVVFSPNENTPKTLADANKIFTKMLEK